MGTEAAKLIEGGCLCGAARYRTIAAPINVRVCHCHICQKATGSPFFARVLVPLDLLTIIGPVSWAHSSPELRRGFCGQCGTMLFSERASGKRIGLSFGSLDDPALFRPTDHVWISAKQTWLELNDGLPQHLEGLPT
jgi:hypothetical protein